MTTIVESNSWKACRIAAAETVAVAGLFDRLRGYQLAKYALHDVDGKMTFRRDRRRRKGALAVTRQREDHVNMVHRRTVPVNVLQQTL